MPKVNAAQDIRSPLFTVIIPARYGSSRLPGKPLALIGGKPMVQHVYERASQSQAHRVVVATDDLQIVDAVNAFGGRVVMTAAEHNSGTNRLQETANLLQLDRDHIVVNVQGDEPFIPAIVIDQVAANLQQNQQFAVATLYEKITDSHDFINPNVVKVVADINSRALYFSRASIPFVRDNLRVDGMGETADIQAYRHIGIYAYRVSLLNRFVHWPMAPLEKLECLEQLRVLFNGENIHVAEALAAVPGGIDTEEDLTRIRQRFSKMVI